MNKLKFHPIAVAFLFFLAAKPIYAQFNIKFNVLSGTSTTTCTDPVGAPDPQWAVNIDNAGWVSYPSNGICYTNTPNQQFNKNYTCYANVPATIPVCFRAYENDASIFNPCSPVYSCQTELCINVPVPPMGTVPFTITLPAGGQSGGSVNMNIVTSGVPGGINDAICNAIPFGLLQTGIEVGFPDTSIFNNFCGTNTNEPDPGTTGLGWFNNVGVWYSFTTGPNPSDVILITGNSDPSNFGDPINLQLAVYESSNNLCNGVFSLITAAHDPATFDESLIFNCPKPNTTYFILVDGVYISATDISQLHGQFGLSVTQLDVTAASDQRCTAEALGTVPANGNLQSIQYTNACSANTNPQGTTFSLEKSVWLAFTPPPSGHVSIQASSSNIDPINLQVAVFESANGNCTGTFTELASASNSPNNDETIELHCLDPSTTYYIELDGSANSVSGIFTVDISDAGNETPTTTFNPVICFGETFSAAGQTYSQTGNYTEVLQLPSGCDSIVITNLTVLTQIHPNLQVISQGNGLGNTQGSMKVSPTGGAGGYSILWSNGQTTATATGLIGGDNYCVTVTDQNGCEGDTCLIMPYFVNFVPSATGSSLACHGDTNGTIEFSAIGGLPPYNYDWKNQDNTQSGSGFIQIDGQVITLPGLPAGQYSIHIADAVFDTTIMTEILEPTALQLSVMSSTDVTCFGDCNGAINLDIQGGTPPYATLWSNGNTTANPTGLCTGNYQATVTDANGCTAILTHSVLTPPQLTATASEVQPVSCFQGNDGMASVTASENGVSILWSNGETTASIGGLTSGTYDVTVTNSAGCTATAGVTVSSPTEAVGVTIEENQPIICQGDANGVLTASATGPGNFTYEWSNGNLQSSATDLAAGAYSVTVSNENGCTATSSFTLSEPLKIEATATPNEITCIDLPDAGSISVDTVTGGLEPYQYSANGTSFNDSPILQGYPAGLQTFYVKDALGCVAEFQATIVGPTELTIDLGHDEAISLGDSINLKVTANQAVQTYVWSPSESLSCADCPSPVASPLNSTTYEVVVTTPDGCSATDEILVEVNTSRKVYIPNAFSPNGDGFNDEFMPYTDGSVKQIKSFQVFDRQGNNVFKQSNLVPNQPGFGWNGEFRGKLMQPAVFVWFAEIEYLDGRVQIYKGDVLLVL